MIVADRALVVRVHKLRETSKIVSVLGLRHGRARLVAHGGRGARHPFGSSLDPGTEVDLVYTTGARELGTLREATLRRAWLAGENRLEVMGAGIAVLELLDRMVPDGASAPEVTADALACLAALKGAADRGTVLQEFYRFELALLGRLGLQPDLAVCSGCGRPSGALPAVLDIREGRLECAGCARSGAGRVALGAEVVAALAGLAAGGNEPPASARTRRAVGLVLHRLLAAHVDGYRYPHALALLKKMDTSAPVAPRQPAAAERRETA